MRALRTVFTLMMLFFNHVLWSQTQVQTRYGDRLFVGELLLRVFGPDCKTIVEKEVFNKPHIFGGPCDPYSQRLVKVKEGYKTVGPREKCSESFFSQYRADLIVENSPLRSGAIAKVCQSLSQKKACLNHALKGIDKEKDSIEEIFRLFYPIGHERLLGEFKMAFEDVSRKKSIDHKFLLKLFCQSEEWQIL